MKIVQIISGLANGGAEKFTIELSNELGKNNEVTLITFRDIDEQMIFPKWINENVQVLELGKKSGFSVKLYYQLFKILKKINPEVVHFHLDATFKYVFLMAFIFTKAQFIFTIHSKPIPSNISIFKKINKIIPTKKNVKYVCISKNIFYKFKEMFPKTTFYCIENGVTKLIPTENLLKVQKEINNFKNNKETKILVSVGRLDKFKNHILLQRTLNNFPYENVKAIVIGEDPNNDVLYSEELKKNTTPIVQFIGKKENVADYLFCADAFVLTSLFEGLPISALEALSAGLPILTTPCDGMIDLIQNDINGFISKDFSEGEFTRIVKNFISSPIQKLKNIAENNTIVYNEKYTMKICAEKYYELYKNTK